MHPAHSESCIEAYRRKQQTEEIRTARLQLTIAHASGIKIKGRQPRINDFLPEWASLSNEEMMMAEIAREVEKQKQNG